MPWRPTPVERFAADPVHATELRRAASGYGPWHGEVVLERPARAHRVLLVTMDSLRSHRSDEAHSVRTCLDITDQARATGALLRTQEAYNRSPDPTYWVQPDGRIAYVNEAACVSTGYTASELLRMEIFELDTDVRREDWAAHWERSRRDGTTVIETRHRRRDGEEMPVEVAITMLRFGAEEFHAAVARDLSARRASEAAIRESEARLHSALAATGQALFDVNIQTGEVGATPEYARMLGVDPVGFRETLDGGSSACTRATAAASGTNTGVASRGS